MKTYTIQDLRVSRILFFTIGFATALLLRAKWFIAILVMFGMASCQTYYTTNYKIETPKGNFYTNDFVIKNDSIFMIETNRNGDIRRAGVFKESEVNIITERKVSDRK